eukprot:COSAG02_NODE_2017_length_10096_cov_52.537061_8_plen_117_part_00
MAALSSSSACCRVAAGMSSWVCALKEREYIQRLKGAEGYTKPAEEEAEHRCGSPTRFTHLPATPLTRPRLQDATAVRQSPQVLRTEHFEHLHVHVPTPIAVGPTVCAGCCVLHRVL